MQLKPGTLLQGGKYKIESVLGQGGFGITYLATQDILERRVAIKEFFFRELCERVDDASHVTLGTASNRDTVDRFLTKFIKEARTISMLQHPGIIQIHDIFRENGTAYYVMEYIEGESLGDMVKRRGNLPETEAIDYIKQTADALNYIHQRNINHLDIKPSNIMLRRIDQQIVLIDFGVAKQYDEHTKESTTTTPVGISHGYSPAEQYKKNGVQQFSPQSDVYALAATLYKLLTGKTPPEALDVQDTGLPTDELRASGVSVRVIRAISHAMQSRSTRTQSVSQFIKELTSSAAIQPEETEIIMGQTEKSSESAGAQSVASPVSATDGKAASQKSAADVVEGIPATKQPVVGVSASKPMVEGVAATKQPAEAPVVNGIPTTNKPDVSGTSGAQKPAVSKPVLAQRTSSPRVAALKSAGAQTPAAKKSKSNSTMWIIIVACIIMGAILTAVVVNSLISLGQDLDPVAEEVVQDEPKTAEVSGVSITLGNLGKCTYSGQVDSDGKPDGQGTATWSDGRKYKGPFVHGVAEGADATYIYSNGDVYKGSFKNNAFAKGRYTVKTDGTYFVGTFKDGDPASGRWYNNEGKEVGVVE